MSDVVPASGLEVSDGRSELLLHLGTTLVASFNLSELVLGGHAINETGKQMIDTVNIAVKVGKHMALDKSAGRGSNEIDRDIGKVVSCLDIVLAGQVRLLLGDVSLDLCFVLEVVNCEGLAEVFGVLENSGP